MTFKLGSVYVIKVFLQEPWTVSIVKEERTKLHCSGSIISEEHILTSAHCFSSIDKKSLQIVAGATDPLGPEKEIKKRGGEIVKIKDVTIHDLYNAESR
jgi:secreted trypsin-like serine protease